MNLRDAAQAAPTYRIIKDSTHDERSIKDGQYSCTCCHCLRTFTGHKRSVCCEVCKVEPPKLAANKAQDAQPCPDCGKTTAPDTVHTCSPQVREWAGLTDDDWDKIQNDKTLCKLEGRDSSVVWAIRLTEAALKAKNERPIRKDKP